MKTIFLLFDSLNRRVPLGRNVAIMARNEAPPEAYRRLELDEPY